MLNNEKYAIEDVMFEIIEDEDFSIIITADGCEVQRHDFSNSVDSQQCFEIVQSTFRLITDCI